MGAYTIKGIKVHVDGYVWDNVQTGKELIKANFDNVICIDGMEGCGKSEFAFQWAIIQTDGEFSEKDIFYTGDQFEEWVKKAKKGDVGVWDEFVLAGMSTDALTKMQNSIIKMFTIMRSKGLTIILVIPYFFMLRKYFAVARTRALVHIYANGLQRGHLKFFNYSQKHWIYNYGQKTWIYSPKVNPSFKANFWVWSEKFINHTTVAKIKQQALDSINSSMRKEDIAPTKKQAEAILDMNMSAVYDRDSSQYKALLRFRAKLSAFYVDK